MALAPVRYGILLSDPLLTAEQAHRLERLRAVCGAVPAAVFLAQDGTQQVGTPKVGTPRRGVRVPVPDRGRLGEASLPWIDLPDGLDTATIEALAELDLAFLLGFDATEPPEALRRLVRCGVWTVEANGAAPSLQPVAVTRVPLPSEAQHAPMYPGHDCLRRNVAALNLAGPRPIDVPPATATPHRPRVVMIGRDPILFPLARSEQHCDLYHTLAADWERLDVVTTSTLPRGHVEQCGNITIHAGPRALGMAGHLSFLAYAIPKLRELERTVRPDVYWASDPFDGGVAAVTVAQRGGGAMLLDVQGDLYRVCRERFGFAKRSVMAALTTLMARRADRVRVLSRDMQTQLVQRGVPADRLAVISARADFALFDPARWADEGRAKRASWGWPDGLVVLYVGAMNATKGPDLLLRAVARSSRPVQVVLVGDGPMLADLRPLAASLGLGGRVRFEGKVSYHRVPAWYAAADAICVPSRDEGMGRGAIQGAAMELPAILTAVGGNPEVIAGGAKGWLVPPTVEGLADGIEALARLSPEQRRALGRRARRDAMASFEMAANCARMRSELIDELVLARPRMAPAG